MTLRPLRASDAATLSAWLPRAAAELGCERWADDAALASAVGTPSAFVYAEDETEAFVVCETGAPGRDAARIDLLAVAPGRRRLGAGSRAAMALERRLRRSAKRLYVLVPSHLGLALYFWLRLGYRPLTQRDWPAQPERAPAAWMVRELG